MARMSSVRQEQPLGLGHAVLTAREAVGDEAFAVILPRRRYFSFQAYAVTDAGGVSQKGWRRDRGGGGAAGAE